MLHPHPAQLVGHLPLSVLSESVSIDDLVSIDVLVLAGEVFLLCLDADQLLQGEPVVVLGMGSLAEELLLGENLVDVTVAGLLGDFLLWFGFFGFGVGFGLLFGLLLVGVDFAH